MSSSTSAWIRLPLAVLKAHGLTKTDAVILAYIIDQCIDMPDYSKALAADTIAQAVGASLRQVGRSCATLEQLGAIERKRTGRATRYTLTQAVEILPRKRRGQRTQSSALSDESLQDYLSVVNRFRRD
jgi:hypothetical protein